MRALGIGITGLLLASTLEAQVAMGDYPDGFIVRLDDATESGAEIEFVTMRPGWHITTGPAAILFDPALQASGSYRVDAETFLFDPAERVEAYGVLLGGRDLSAADQAYTYFVIRHTGEYSIRQRRGERVESIVEWTSNAAIVTWAGRGDGVTAKNELAVVVDANEVRFLVNGKELTVLPRARVDADGVVGLRVNHGLNLHVSSLTVTKK